MKFFWGLVFTGIGVLLLGGNLGWWTTNFWELLWYFWPLIIIVLGLRFIINDDKTFMILTLLIVLASGYLIVREPNGVLRRLGTNIRQTTENFTQSFVPSEVEKLNLKFNLGASKVNFSSLSDEESKVSLYDVEAKNYGKLTPNKKVNGEEVEVNFTEEMADGRSISRFNKRELIAGISRVPELWLDINSGASKFEGDFSNLRLRELDFKTGASEIDVKFGDIVELLEAHFQVGASSIEIDLPKNVAVKVEFESEAGLNNFRYDNGFGFSKENHVYKSKDYDTAEKKINLRLSAGVSEIKLNQY